MFWVPGPIPDWGRRGCFFWHAEFQPLGWLGARVMNFLGFRFFEFFAQTHFIGTYFYRGSTLSARTFTRDLPYRHVLLPGTYFIGTSFSRWCGNSCCRLTSARVLCILWCANGPIERLPCSVAGYWCVRCILHYGLLCIRYHISCIMYYVVCSMYHVSCIMYHVSCIMHYVLWMMYYVLWIMYYALCIMYYALCIVY